MNEFWELHRKAIIFFGIFFAVAVVSWFAFGSKLYANIEKGKEVADGKYFDLKGYEVGTPISIAKTKFAEAITNAASSFDALKTSLSMSFNPYVEIPDKWASTKNLYFDKMLRETRESRLRDASINRVLIPEKLGWQDINDVPKKEQDAVIPKMLRQLSTTDTVITLLIYSRVQEIKSIKYDEPYVEGPGGDYPEFTRLYPVSVTFVTNVNSLIFFQNLIHYIDTGAASRKVGQFFEVDYFSVRWNGDNPSKELIVSCRLNALEFFTPAEKVEPTTGAGQSAPMGY